MPETRLQEVVFALLMSFFMVLGMEFYNGSIQMGEWTRAVFPIMFGEMRFMLPLCFATSYFVMDKIAQKLMLRLVTPGQDKPILVVLVRSGITVSLMCPAMSFWATLIFMASAWILSISGSAPSSAISQWRFSGRFFTAARWCGSCLAAFSLAEGKKLFKKDLAKAANLCYDGKKEAMCHEMSLLRKRNDIGIYPES